MSYSEGREARHPAAGARGPLPLRAPARYDDLVQVHAGISEWGRASLVFVYEMWNEDKSALLSTGSTQHALVTREGRPVAVPDWFKALFLPARRRSGGESGLGPVKLFAVCFGEG